jgi:hypothetical protein
VGQDAIERLSIRAKNCLYEFIIELAYVLLNFNRGPRCLLGGRFHLVGSNPKQDGFYAKSGRESTLKIHWRKFRPRCTELMFCPVRRIPSIIVLQYPPRAAGTHVVKTSTIWNTAAARNDIPDENTADIAGGMVIANMKAEVGDDEN